MKDHAIYNGMPIKQTTSLSKWKNCIIITDEIGFLFVFFSQYETVSFESES